MTYDSRIRGCSLLATLFTFGATAYAPSARAQSQSDAGAPEPPQAPTTRAIPHGASGAIIVPPKDDPAAAPPQAAAPPVIVPPVVTKDEGVAYPAAALARGFRESVKVVVILDVDPTGGVKKATIDAPDPAHAEFEAAALEAAQKLVLTPGTRNGTPIAVRIKRAFDFAPPAARLVGRAYDQVTSAPIAGATVVLTDAANPNAAPQTITTGDNGDWRADGLAGGKYHVQVTTPQGATDAADVEVAAGEEGSVVLRIAAPKLAIAGVDGGLAADEEIEEVKVEGTRPPREVTRRTLEQRELTRIPGTNGDAIRALQNLPGVARPPGIAGLLIIRGSAPNATNVFVDGTLIPLVYHFGGLSSVVPSEMLDRIDFYPGNFSAQYGRVTGGIIDVAIRDPHKDKIRGMAQVDLIDARVLADGPIGNTGWTFAVGGRRSYVDVWLKPVLTAAGAGVSTAPVYYDYQALVQHDIGKNGNFRLLFFGSDDKLSLLIKQATASDPAIGGDLGFHTGFYRAQARWKQKFSADTELEVMGSIGRDTVEFNIGDNKFTLDSYPINSRIELGQKFAKSVKANVGIDLLYAPYDVFVRLPAPGRPGEPPAGPGLSRPPLTTQDSDAVYRPAAYAEFELTPFRGTRIVPGIRADYAKDTKQWDVAPRIVVRQDLTYGYPRTTIKGGIGSFYQPPQPQETNAVFGVPGAVSQHSIHYDVGAEQEFSRHLDASLEGYYKTLDHAFTQGLGSVASGQAYGLELLVRYKPDERFFGWVAYTLSRSELRDSPNEALRLAQFDQTHILTILGSYRLGRGWEIGGRFRLVSGNPTTPSTYGYLDENAVSNLAIQSYPPLGQRLPLFHQLDIRVDKTWEFKSWRLGAYLDVQNVYNSGNVEGTSYNYNSTSSVYANGLPLLPSLGLRAEL